MDEASGIRKAAEVELVVASNDETVNKTPKPATAASWNLKKVRDLASLTSSQNKVNDLHNGASAAIIITAVPSEDEVEMKCKSHRKESFDVHFVTWLLLRTITRNICTQKCL